MKINKQTFDFIKSSLKQEIPIGKIIHDLKISVTTLNKIKNVDSFEEHKGYMSTDEIISTAPKLIRQMYNYKPKFSLLRTIKNLLHLK